MKNCEFCNLTPEEEKFLLYQNAHWKVYLSDEQDYIGRCIIAAKTHYESLGDLPANEWLSLKEIINALESILKEVLHADMFNWSCLMNNAYKNETPAPHVHFHFRPRYKSPIKINGKEFSDGEFARHYSREKIAEIDTETKDVLFNTLKNEMGKYFAIKH